MPSKHKAPPPPPEPAASYLEKEDSLNDLLHDIHHDTQQQQHQKVHVTQKRLRENLVDEAEIEDDENLGENFEQTPWVPPSIEKAKEFRKKAIYRGGDARIDSIEVVRVSDLGAGVTLYFQFALSMTVCLFIMSLLSLPALIFAYNGKNMAIDEQDSFGLYKYTLGNIGYDAADRPRDYLCSHLGVVGMSYGKNETCIQIASRTIPMSQAASVMTAMEFLQIVVFFIGVFHLYRTALSVTGRNAKAETSVTDFAVMVTDLPKDITDVELVDHFSSLYRLDGRDFRNRPGVEGAQPVSELHNSGGNSLLLGTWVAECILHKGIGAFVSDFKSKAHVMEKMYRARATMKMYAENSPHKDGHNLVLFQRAEKVVQATGALIDEITQKNLQRAGLKILAADGEDPEAQQVSRSVSDPKSIYYNIDAPPVAAFIVFEHAESFARCLRDHAQYAHYPMRWFYPNVLKIKGQKVNVARASEPDQILWENLDVTKRQKTYLRIRTAMITLLLVIGCFIVVLQASIYKTIFANRVPDNSVCASAVPLLYVNDTDASLTSLSLVRPTTTASQQTLDAECAAVTGRSDAFYAVYAYDENFGSPATDRYNMSACKLSGALDTYVEHSFSSNGQTYSYSNGRKDALCPEPRRARYCPCVSTAAKTECQQRECFFPTAEGSNRCETFTASSIGACYCYQELAALVSSSGVVDTLNKINSLKSGPCGNFYQQYSLSVALTYVAVLVTTIVNVFLRTFLKRLAKHEARANTDEEQGSVMLKIFLSNYATMAIIILVAYGKAKDLPAFLQTLHIFDGVYGDFSTGWYGQVGYFLVTTSILQSFSPLVANLFLHYVGKPLLRWYHHGRVRALKSHSIVMQHDLNMLEVGPVFDSTDHTAQLLTLLFFSMTFAPGLPLLMPLCCFAFALYFRVDKLLLCRYYQAPPHVGDATIRLVVLLLPVAAIIRLGFACWMFSCPDTAFGRGAIEASSVSIAYRDFLETARSSSASSGFTFANDRIFQPNTFPLFVLLLIVAAIVVLARVYQEIPLHLLFTRLLDCVNSLSADGHASADARRLAEVARSGHRSEETPDDLVSAWSLAKLNDPLRQQSAGYTREYFRYVKHRDEIPDSCYDMFAYAYLTKLTDLDKDQGWQLEERGEFVVRTKVFLDASKRLDGSRARVGERKRTYEVVADNKCFSYDIEKVPAYSTAMRGLREGTTSLQDTKFGNTTTGGAVSQAYDESDLANKVLSHYQHERPVSAQPHSKQVGHVADLDSPVDGHHRVKPHADITRPKTGQQQVAVDVSSPSNHTRPGTSSASAAGNFTFDDFANMDFAETAHPPIPAEHQSHPHHHHSHHSHHAHGGAHDKIHISKEHKQKLRQHTQTADE